MEVDGEEGCEGNETSLIAYQRAPESRVGSRAAVSCGLCEPSFMEAVHIWNPDEQ